MRKNLTFSLVSLTTTFTVAAAQAPQVGWFKDLKVLSSVAIAEKGDLVFVGSDARIHRTDARGIEKWNYATGDIGRAHPLITPQDNVIAASYDDNVYALDPAGKLLWKTKLDGDVFAS
ncbi:MAG: PQQ-binding-like beta-propeller repeat protein, partial [Deinococcota bacterium]